MILIESTHADVFEKSTHTSFYDGILDDSPLGNSDYTTKEYYRFEKGIEGEIVPMTGDEYIERVARDAFGCTVGQALKDVSQYKVDKYAELMKQGTKFPLPYVGTHPYHGDNQEGRHRMLAMKKAFGDDAVADVLVYRAANPTEEEMYEYANKKYPKDPDWVVNSIIKPAMSKYCGAKMTPIEEDEPAEDITGLDIERGDIIDYGDGWVEVTNVTYDVRSGLNYVEGVFADDEDKDVEYYIKDEDDLIRKVK